MPVSFFDSTLWILTRHLSIVCCVYYWKVLKSSGFVFFKLGSVLWKKLVLLFRSLNQIIYVDYQPEPSVVVLVNISFIWSTNLNYLSRMNQLYLDNKCISILADHFIWQLISQIKGLLLVAKGPVTWNLDLCICS